MPFSAIPAVLMLTRIASARNGERITSIAADAKFFAVLVFIFPVSPTFFNATHDCFAPLGSITSPVPTQGRRDIYEKSGVFAIHGPGVCRPRLTNKTLVAV